MTNIELLKCSQSIYDFLIESDVNWRNSNLLDTFETPMLKKMDKILTKHGFDMVEFTYHLNKIYRIYSEPLWDSSAKDFFASTKGVNFYKIAIRNLKLNQLCQKL